MAQTDTCSSDLEQTLQAAIASGSLVDLGTREPERDDPAHGHRWERSRTIRAETLIDLLTGRDPIQEAHQPRALRLAGAKITGTLDLQAAELLCPVTLQSCWFEQPVNRAEATGSSLRLPGCHLPALDAEQLNLRANLEFGHGFTAYGEVNLFGAHIGGHLSFAGARLTNPHGLALVASGMSVNHDMHCTSGFTVQGEVGLSAAHIGGQLLFVEANLTNPDGLALNASRLTVDQDMVCRGGFSAHGVVNLRGSHIRGVLGFIKARLINPDGLALTATTLTVDQDMVCRGVTTQGEVRLVGTHIGGQLNFQAASLTNPDGPALNADRLIVDQGMTCGEGFTAHGEVNLRGAHIGGYLTFEGASLSNPDGYALQLQHAQAATLFLRNLTEAPVLVDLTMPRSGRWLRTRSAGRNSSGCGASPTTPYTKILPSACEIVWAG